MKSTQWLSVGFLLILASAGTAVAQYDIHGFSAAVESGDIDSAYAELNRNCGVVRQDATVDVRLEEATKRRRCIEHALSLSALGASDAKGRAVLEVVRGSMLEAAKKDEQEQAAGKKFLDLNWGVGFGYSFSSGDAVDEATIVDGVVRVTSSNDDQPRVLLEAHSYLWCNNGRVDSTRGCGPFLAVATKDDDILGGIALGFMYGRRPAAGEKEGFSVGIGAILDRDVKYLGDGFTVNEPPPGEETAIRYQTKSRWSLLLFVTRTF